VERKLSIGYFADGKWAHEAFKLIQSNDDIDIKFICARFDSEDKILKNFAEEYNIDYLKYKNVNSEEFLKKISGYECDLFVSMSFNQIFKTKIINIPKYKLINCHAGKLPFYRGRNVLNWVLINDEKDFGITVHYVDEGIDTGDIILQRTFKISDSDKYSTLLDKAYVECARILYDAIVLIQKGEVTTIKQRDIHKVGMYCGIRKEGDEVINWDQNSRELFNFIRAICDPGPMARSVLNGKEIKINASEIIEGAPIYKGIVGQVLNKEAGSFIVKVKDTVLKITEYIYDGNIKVGDRLG
jgi:methionyl-tRNA formyltransferase